MTRPQTTRSEPARPLLIPAHVRQHLESLAAAGVLDLPRCEVAPPSVAATPSSSPSPLPASRVAKPAGDRPAVATPTFTPLQDVQADGLAERQTGLAALRDEVAACTRCQELACSRKQTVFGSGPAAARICFFGEAPGADEDASGEPFVGKAGQLLTKIIEACQLQRDEVFILNVLKCRPPANRRPEPTEVENCRRYFERQLELIQPEVICCLGATAAQTLLATTESIGKLRGRWHKAKDAAVICTYHPSYLLRNPSAKRDVWDDMKTMMRHFGVEL